MGRDDGYYCYVLCFLSKVPSFYSIHWSFYRPMQVLSHVVERSVFRKHTLPDQFQSLEQFFDQNIIRDMILQNQSEVGNNMSLVSEIQFHFNVSIITC